jgi:AcrR family transcriptional regulator
VAEHPDQETRERLLTAATRLFAEQGFDAVTVRDICRRASANVAAVNYHFGGKVGLYEQVMDSAIRIMQATTEEARRQGLRKTPDEQLRIYVHVFISRVATGSGGTWIHQLMMREISVNAAFAMTLDRIEETIDHPTRFSLAGISAMALPRERG